LAAGNITHTASAVRPDAPKVDVAFQGARRGYSLPQLLERAGILGIFYTDAYLGNKPWLRRSLKRVPSAIAPAALRRMLGRENTALPASKVVSFDAFGWKAVWLRSRARSRGELQRYYALLCKEFCERVARNGLGGATAIYGFKCACLEIFREARRRGMLCIMEQNSAAERIEDELVRQEVQRWKGWERSIEQELADSDVSPLRDREEAEWRLADAIVCPSDFVASGLKSLGVADEKCRLLPYGIDTSKFRPMEKTREGGGLNLLFNGFVGLRKGVPYLLEALGLLHSREIKCRLVGTVELDRRSLEEYATWVEVVGPVPRAEIMRMYHWADALVLPSIAEGSALVTYEALACGLPVVTTPNSGSWVRDGQDGFIVPIRDPEALADRLDRLAADRELLRAMSAQALARRDELGLEAYNSAILKLIHSMSESRMRNEP
jgi:hypothetical protein